MIDRYGFLSSIVAATAAVASPLPVPSAAPTGAASLAVYHLRGSAPAAPLAPDDLLHAKGVRIYTIEDASEIVAAQAAIDAALARPMPILDAPVLDVRWGMRFATATGRFVHSVYCDASGGVGQLDGRPVSFGAGAGLVAFLEKRFDAS